MVSPINAFRLAVTAVGNAYKAEQEQQEQPGEGLFQAPTRPDTFGDTSVDPVVAMSDELDAAYGDVEGYTSLRNQPEPKASDADIRVYNLWRPGEVPVQNAGIALRSLVRPGLTRSMLGRMSQNVINEGGFDRNDDGEGFFANLPGSAVGAATGALGALVNAFIPAAGAQTEDDRLTAHLEQQPGVGVEFEDAAEVAETPISEGLMLPPGARPEDVPERPNLNIPYPESLEVTEANPSGLTRAALGVTNLASPTQADGRRVRATVRLFNWGAIGRVRPSTVAGANYERAFAGRTLNNIDLPGLDGSEVNTPAFATPADGVRYFGWWLQYRGPKTIQSMANMYYPTKSTQSAEKRAETLAGRAAWLKAVTEYSGLPGNTEITPDNVGQIAKGVFMREAGPKTFTGLELDKYHDFGQLVEEGRDMWRQAARELNAEGSGRAETIRVQQEIGAVADGVFGPNSRAAAREYLENNNVTIPEEATDEELSNLVEMVAAQ